MLEVTAAVCDSNDSAAALKVLVADLRAEMHGFKQQMDARLEALATERRAQHDGVEAGEEESKRRCAKREGIAASPNTGTTSSTTSEVECGDAAVATRA